MAFLHQNPYLPGMPVDMTWVTKAMWTFMVRHATKSTRKAFQTLVDGVKALETYKMERQEHQEPYDDLERGKKGSTQAAFFLQSANA